MSAGFTVVELRIHGVSGTSPEAMLSCPPEFLVQLEGDRDAGFYRRAAWIDDAAAPRRNGVRRVMEAYSWGGLTSRRSSRALWLLLVPFSLVNLAHWMLPPVTHRRPAAVVVAALRLLALSFTATLLLASAVTVLDLTMWQCADMPYCVARWGPLAVLAEPRAGIRLVVGALPLVAVILGLWLLGREKTRPLIETAKPPPEAVVPRGAPSPLADDTFWNDDSSVAAMRACHVIAWTTGLAMLVLAAPLGYGTSDLTRAGSRALLVVNAVVLFVVVLATASTAITGRGGPQVQRAQGWLGTLRAIALAMLAVTLVWVALRGDVHHPPGFTALPGLATAVYGVIVVQAVLLIVVFAGAGLAVLGQKPSPPGFRVTLHGFTGPFVALLGALIGGGFSVGVGMWTAQILGTPVYAADEARRAVGSFEHRVAEAAPLIVPPPFAWGAVATALVVIAACVVGVVVWCAYGCARRARRAAPGTAEATLSHNAWARISRSQRLARLPDAGPAAIALLTLLAVVFIVVSAVLPLVSPWVRDRQFELLRAGAVITAPVVLLAVVLVMVTVAAVRSRQVRRVVAILWDVVTFWPQVTHPLTPPSYGGRTVWDLRVRMGGITADPDGAVVLVAHSQGTVIAAATLMQCVGPDEKYPLLTFGSPLRRLYATNFPAYFGHEALLALRNQLTHPRRWINLWSRTDPIGGWIFSDEPLLIPGDSATAVDRVLAGVDARILDVPQQNPAGGNFAVDEFGPLNKHSGYWHRYEYTLALERLQSLVSPGEVDPGATAPPTDAAM